MRKQPGDEGARLELRKPLDQIACAQLLEDADEPLIAADGDLRVRLASAGAARMLGVPRAQLQDRALPALLAGDWASDPPMLAHGWRATRAGDGWAVRGPAGGPDAESVRMHRMMEGQQLAAMGQLAAGVAHEVGAPLTAISATVEYLLKNEVDPASAVGRDLEVVLSQAQRLERLARSLLDLARPASPTFVATDLNALVIDVFDLLRRQLRRSGVESILDLGSELPLVRSDPNQLQQVLINLLLNAQRAACAASAAARTVTVCTRAAGTLVELRVVDQGPGIPQEDHTTIFLPFFSREGGSGLGLSIARGVVHRNGGSLRVESRVGEGSTFIVELPRWIDETD